MDYKSNQHKTPAAVCGIIDLGIQEDDENHIMLMLELMGTPQRSGHQLQGHQTCQNEIICLQMKNGGGLSCPDKNILDILAIHKAQTGQGVQGGQSKKEIVDAFIFDMENSGTWNVYYKLPTHIQLMIKCGAKRLAKKKPCLKGVVPEVTRRNKIRKSRKISICHVIPCVIIGGFIILLAVQTNIALTAFIAMFAALAIFNQRESNRQRFAGVKLK